MTGVWESNGPGRFWISTLIASVGSFAVSFSGTRSGVRLTTRAVFTKRPGRSARADSWSDGHDEPGTTRAGWVQRTTTPPAAGPTTGSGAAQVQPLPPPLR